MTVTVPRRVWVRVGPVGRDYPSRLVDHHGEDLVVAAPAAEDEVAPVELGQMVVITWLTPTGVHELTATLLQELEERSRWIVRPRGPAVRTQRRAYVRIGTAALIDLRRGGGDIVRAGLVDLSEGGIRCIVPGVSDLDVSDQVETSLELDGVQIDVRARVVRRQTRRDGRCELGLRFVEVSGAEADCIRRYVFARLGRERARGLV